MLRMKTLVMTAFAVMLAVSANAVTWDAAADFSTTLNPTGPWSYYGLDYGNETTPIAYNNSVTPLNAWINNQNSPDGFGQILKNIGTSEIVDVNWWGTRVIEPGMLTVYPGAAIVGGSAFVRWTAPYDMNISIHATWTGQIIGQAFDNYADDTVKVLQNGNQLFSAVVNGFGGYGTTVKTGATAGGTQIFNSQSPIHVLQGGTIDFYGIGNKDLNTFHYDLLGLNAVVTEVVPEPGSFATLAFGLIGTVGAVIRRKR